jgi:hypothetical protein
MAKMHTPSASMLTLWGLMKSGKSVNFEDIVTAVGQKRNSVMVLICTMRFDFGAEIETEREGRKVKSYKLTNPDVVAPRMVAKTTSPKNKAPKTIKTPKVLISKNKINTVTKNKSVDIADTVDNFDIEEISDAEFSDLKQQFGF